MFLRDEDIKVLVASGAITNIADLTSKPDGPKSPIQPCSLDLTIGKIFIPESTPTETGGRDTPKKNHALGPGETVVVETAETFHLPEDIAGFGFPPTSVANIGVLVTNLGHIDPGFDGKMQFTLVNMGHEHYSLKEREPIYTLLLFKLNQAPKKDYRSRHPDLDPEVGHTGVSQELLDGLSRDFLNVGNRATEAAKAAITAELKSPLRGAISTGIVAILVLGSGALFNYFQVGEIKSAIPDMEKSFEKRISDLQEQINSQERISKLESEIKLNNKRLKQ